MKNNSVKRSLITKAVFLSFSLGTLLAVTMAGTARAQVSASISGRVEDTSGAAVPEATVTATSVETGATRTVKTDPGGIYRVLSLPVGQYEIRAEIKGFKVVVRKGVNLVVGQEAVVNLTLEVGEIAQSVTVTGEAPVVNTTTASVSGLVNERQVKDLPLNGRSFDNLISLNPGAINYTAMKTGLQGGGGPQGNLFAVAGRRPAENFFLLNGIEYTGSSNVTVSPGGVSGQLLGIDAVREFNVVTDTYSAQYGKRAGAQVSIVTQSGTNQLHGTAFEFLRNSALDARNFFDYPLGVRIPAFRRNQFGGALGGPLQRDQTFLFGNYEGFRQRLGISSVATVPDANARRGLLPDAAGIPTAVPGFNPAMLPYMSFWPLPNGPNLGGGVALAYNNPKQSVREDFGTTRLDRTFSNRDSFSGAFTFDDGDSLNPLLDPLFAAVVSLRSEVTSLQETRVFSPRLVNTFRLGYSRAEFSYDTPPLTPYSPSLSFVAGSEPGAITIGAGQTGAASPITAAGASNTPAIHNARTLFTYDDALQIIRGKHQISVGGWFQQIRSNADTASQKAGRAQFSNLQSFLQGMSSNVSAPPITTPIGWRSLEGAWYAEDSIALRPNLNLRLGLRHEFTNGYNEQFNRAANFSFTPNGVLLTNPRIGKSVFTENNARWLFSPRAGLAWDPFGKGKTSIRAGFGVYYTLQDFLDFILNSIPPFNGVVSFQNVPLFSVVPIRPGTPPPPACGPGVPQPCTVYAPQGLQSSMKTPTVEEWNFTVEQQLTASMSLRLAYIGSWSYHQIASVDSNTVRPQICSNPGGCQSGGVGRTVGLVPNGAEYIPVGTRPNPFLANGWAWLSESNGSYNSLQVDLAKRFTRGLQFRANYTWSKNLDVVSAQNGSVSINEAQLVMDPYDIHRDWGPAALNPTHQASANFSYQLPIGKGKPWLGSAGGAADKLASGWQFNAIVALLSGFPLTPQVGSNQSGDGNTRNSDRPNVNPAFSGPVILGRVDRWFNPSAFQLPIPGTYGNLGRGTLWGPGLRTLDVSLFKTTPITERGKLEFRAEFFNLLNRANFGTPNPVVSAGGAVSPSAGIVTSTATTSRQMQFGLKLVF